MKNEQNSKLQQQVRKQAEPKRLLKPVFIDRAKQVECDTACSHQEHSDDGNSGWSLTAQTPQPEDEARDVDSNATQKQPEAEESSHSRTHIDQ